MGTTLTLAKVHGDEVSLAHVGDSRAYRMRDGELSQLTRDHSLVAELERSGQITAEAAEHHPQRSIITRALGPEPDVEVDTYTLAGRDGDVFLICSDGLTSMISDDEVALDPALGEHARRGRGRARARRQPERRQGQHHGDPVPARARASPRRRRRRPSGRRRTRTRSSAAARRGAPGGGRARRRSPRAGRRRSSTGRAEPPPRRRPSGPAGRAPPRPRAARAAGRARPGRARRGRRRPLRAEPAGLLRRDERRGARDRLQGHPLRAAARHQPLHSRTTPAACPHARSRRARRARVLDHEWRSRSDAVDLVRALERGQLDAGASS